MSWISFQGIYVWCNSQLWGILENGTKYFFGGNWDLVIAYLLCTFLAVSGARWYYHFDGKSFSIDQRCSHPKFPDRAKDCEEAILFFMDVSKIGVNKLVIEIWLVSWVADGGTLLDYRILDIWSWS